MHDELDGFFYHMAGIICKDGWKAGVSEHFFQEKTVKRSRFALAMLCLIMGGTVHDMVVLMCICTSPIGQTGHFGNQNLYSGTLR
jgi:hypothetical protein